MGRFCKGADLFQEQNSLKSDISIRPLNQQYPVLLLQKFKTLVEVDNQILLWQVQAENTLSFDTQQAHRTYRKTL